MFSCSFFLFIYTISFSPYATIVRNPQSHSHVCAHVITCFIYPLPACVRIAVLSQARQLCICCNSLVKNDAQALLTLAYLEQLRVKMNGWQKAMARLQKKSRKVGGSLLTSTDYETDDPSILQRPLVTRDHHRLAAPHLSIQQAEDHLRTKLPAQK